MELALTALIWVIIAVIGLPVLVWLTIMVVALLNARKVRKHLKDNSTFGGRL